MIFSLEPPVGKASPESVEELAPEVADQDSWQQNVVGPFAPF